jgi:hypothetical protein
MHQHGCTHWPQYEVGRDRGVQSAELREAAVDVADRVDPAAVR